MVRYCIYCGEDYKEGHSKSCPLISGIPKGVYGVSPREGDIEYNLSLGRMGILLSQWTDYTKKLGEVGRNYIGPKDKTIEYHLVYEEIAFQVRRLMVQHLHHSAKSRSLLGFYHRSKLKELDKHIEKLKTFAKVYNFPISKVDEIINSEKIVLLKSSDKEEIPAYRDSETGRLIYASVN